MIIEIPDSFFTQEELENTPKRYKRFLEEWSKAKDFKFTRFPNKNPKVDQLIVQADIPFYSLCSHHLVVFEGKAHIGYVPKKELCGLSKLPRVVDMFAHRPQMQERLTQQIADFLYAALNPEGVIVVMEARHFCVEMRGVKKPGTWTFTSAIKGLDKTIEDKFMRIIRR